MRKLKNIILKSTRFLGYLLNKLKLPNKNLYFYSDSKNHVFFGYYDLNPFNSSNSLVLANKVPSSPSEDEEEMEIGYYKLDDEKKMFHSLGKTSTWSWQQGCRLRWYPSEHQNLIAYNKLINNQYGTVIRDIHLSKIVKKISSPLYDLTNDGNWGASLNFSRLQRLRPGYGYSNFPDEYIDQKAPSEDGLFLIDLIDNEKELIVSLEEVSKIEPRSEMENAEHYFNHLFFSPDNKYLFFFHLWSKNSMRDSRLFKYNLATKQTDLLINNTISHFAWKDHETILLTEFEGNQLKYNLYNINGEHIERIGENILNRDGHPTYSMDKKYILSDTYPGYFGFRKLFKYFPEKKFIKTISRHYSPESFKGEHKCDLHPRLSLDNKFLCVDTIKKNKRSLLIIKQTFPTTSNSVLSI